MTTFLPFKLFNELTKVSSNRPTTPIVSVPRRVWLFVPLLVALFLSVLAPIGSTQAANPEFLPPEKAFIISAQLTQDELKVTFKAAPGYYMYGESMTLKIKDQATKAGANTDLNTNDNPNSVLTPLLIPKPYVKYDENFQKDVKIYEGEAVYMYATKDLPLSIPMLFDVTVQGCADKGICYPPMLRRITLQEYGKLVISTDPEAIATDPGLDNQATWWDASQDLNALNRLLTNTSLPLLLLAFFVLGIGLAFTPCMLPMLPILSSIVFGTVDHHLLSRKKTIVLALFYILGMAFAFSLAGMATAWFGAGITAGLQNPWVLIGFGCLMLLLSGGLLGVYELQLPRAWHNVVDRWIGKHKGGNVYGVFALGALSSLVASPCVSAPLAGVLTFIAQSGQVQLGGLILFVMACGMGVPLLLFAIGASRVVPRAGKWMLRVQRFFGILMVALAFWVMLPAIKSFTQGSVIQAVDKKISGLQYDVVVNATQLQEKLLQAKGQGKKAMVVFYADWCVSCKELEIQTLSNPGVVEKLKDYARIEVDITKMGPEQKALLKDFQLFGPPAIVLFDQYGQELPQKKTVGVISAQKFLQYL